MQNEAIMAGLHLHKSNVKWNFDVIHPSHPHESLGIMWWMFEWVPFRRQKHPDPSKITWYGGMYLCDDY
jgi:hypothetical protein